MAEPPEEGRQVFETAQAANIRGDISRQDFMLIMLVVLVVLAVTYIETRPAISFIVVVTPTIVP